MANPTDAKFIVRRLTCEWCGFTDNCSIIYYRDVNPGTNRFKRHGVANQCRCKKCFRFIPNSIKEPTGNLVGRKHIHKR